MRTSLIQKVTGTDARKALSLRIVSAMIAEQPDAAAELDGHSVALFITVDDLGRVEKAVAGAPAVKPRHKTFYGSMELYIREPGGNTVGFAQMQYENSMQIQPRKSGMLGNGGGGRKKLRDSHRNPLILRLILIS